MNTLQDMHTFIAAKQVGHGQQTVFRLYRNLKTEYRAQWSPYQWGSGPTAQAAIDAAFSNAMKELAEC